MKKFLLLKNVKNTVLCTYVIEELNGKEIVRTFYENKLQKANQKVFRVEKAMERKDDKLYVKEKDYDNSFNGWMNKKNIIRIRSI